MSRCFPFPPPGYEKKARLYDDDLLKKEKHQEKKHKKDKDKREKKEKREKDRSDRKHRDSKEKKEKHRKKKKDKEKERDKDRDKSSTSGEKGIVGQSESYSGEKLNQKEKESDTDKSSISDGRKHILQLQSHSGGEPNRNILFVEGTGESKSVHQSGRKIKDEEKGTGSLLFQRLPDMERKNDGQMDRLVKDITILAGEKERNKDKRPENRMTSRQGLMVDVRFDEQVVVPKLAAVVQNGVGGMPKPLEKYSKGRMEQKSVQSEGGDKLGDKQKENGREKKSDRKDKDKKKEKKKEERVKEQSEHKHKEQNRFKGSNMNVNLNNQITRTLNVPGDGDRNTAALVNLKKRKDLEVNGICGADVSPIKMLKSSPHPSIENGRKLEPCQTPILFTSNRQGSSNNVRLDNKVCKVNGNIDAKPLSVSSKKTFPASTQVDHIAPPSMKPPHPDTKYLGQVLSVPKMEEWSEFDDQEWLFSSKDHLEWNADVGSTGVTETPRVWSEPLQIESADVYALPYVIPY